MVKDVILQTVTYLFAVIASILVAFFVISMFTYAKDSLKKYDIVEYKVENYVGMSAAAVNSVFKENLLNPICLYFFSISDTSMVFFI